MKHLMKIFFFLKEATGKKCTNILTVTRQASTTAFLFLFCKHFLFDWILLADCVFISFIFSFFFIIRIYFSLFKTIFTVCFITVFQLLFFFFNFIFSYLHETNSTECRGTKKRRRNRINRKLKTVKICLHKPFHLCAVSLFLFDNPEVEIPPWTQKQAKYLRTKYNKKKQTYQPTIEFVLFYKWMQFDINNHQSWSNKFFLVCFLLF